MARDWIKHEKWREIPAHELAKPANVYIETEAIRLLGPDSLLQKRMKRLKLWGPKQGR
jgi:hypothetical protein